MKIKQELPEELQMGSIEVVKEGYKYTIDMPDNTIHEINFMEGGRKEPTSAGIIHEDLLYIIVDRLKFFKTSCPTDENDEIICLLENAIKLSHDRTIERHNKDTLGNKGEDYKEKG